MSYKENVALGVGTSMSVKPEPQDVAMPRPFAPSLNANPSTESIKDKPFVKPEPRDTAINPFTSRGIDLPQPATNNAPRREAPATPKAIGPRYKVYTSPDDIVYSPENALGEGLGMVQTLQESIKNLQLGSKMRQEVWDREIESLTGQTAPTTLIAVCGATGAGKSSILNAVLKDNIVPTSGMRACTATVTEISYHNKPTIDADVSFLTQAEWSEELKVLLQDLVDEDGNVKRSTDLKSDAGVAWQKVHAVYPTISQDLLVTLTPEQIIARDPKIAAILGATKKIVAKNSKDFAMEIAKYIDSKDQSRGKKKDKKSKGDNFTEDAVPAPTSMFDKVKAAAIKEKDKKKDKKDRKDKEHDPNAPALWPLIRQVNVRCNADALKTGSILVDLPGVADANAARNNIAKDYMKKCQCIWILAPITRAVDDKTARDLLGDAFRMQLMSDYDDHSITFIASKCDDISCTEVIRALQLDEDEDLEAIDERIDENEDKAKALKKEKTTVERALKGIDEEIKDERAIQKELEAHVKALKNGDKFTPKLTAKNKKVAGSKRKNSRRGKAGKSKRQRSIDDDDDSEAEDSDGDHSDSDDDSDAKSDGSNSDSDSDASDDEHSDSKSGANSGDEEMDDEEEQETPESLKSKITESKTKVKEFRGRQSEARKQKKTLGDQLATLNKQFTVLQKQKNAFCSLKRSEFSRDVLKEDFRTGLKDLDDAAAEENDPDNFDPAVNRRDYDQINLPVFTCSSRDYVRLTGQVSGDGDPTCFSNVEDTGIPALQEWCHTLTLSARERSVKAFFKHLETFSASVQAYVEGIRGVTPADREALREKWETAEDNVSEDDDEDPYGMQLDDDPFAAILGGRQSGLLYTMKEKSPKVDASGQPVGITPRLTKEFSTVIEKNVEQLKTIFRDGLEEKCQVGAANAAASAVATSDDVAASMHWQTYRATLRRHGSWRRDLNVELLTPFTKNIASSWGKLFETDLFKAFRGATLATIKELLSDFESSAALGLKDRTKSQAELCLKEAEVALQKTIAIVSESLSSEQKEISRCLAPHVQEGLVEGYDQAMEERGTGSVKRQKDFFHKYIEDHKDNIFENGADVIMERLNTAAASVGSGLAESLGQLAQKIEVNLAVLWEGGNDNVEQAMARDAIVKDIDSISRQVELWRTSERTKRENEQQYDRLVKDYLVEEDTEMD
ncbi:hypothetical protein BDZ89DRAFT_1055778 [Hymenopellis radicata]|nr:hypothetical protein BDZ89DRAFT_1055778 [Hymenopellis radicata]